ncbi:MAG: dimethylsulfoniopropionate demethylase [Acidiferrobacterales bacterium]|nr:dimethylsulfoniopropionate demethylase [Acidiferrobacterales bacterium]
MPASKLQTSIRQRATPYKSRVERAGVTDFSIVNHTLLPKGFGESQQSDYTHLKNHVQLWDVGCQRQVELKGPDAAHLAQLMTPRDLSAGQVGQCFYAPMVDEAGGLLNDPVILKLANDHYWFSIADSDVLLWAKALAYGLRLDVSVDEPDVWPLAVQGPKSDDLLEKVFGESVRSIAFFRFKKLSFQGHPLVVARAGYSKQGGFEIYLDDSSLGPALWDACWDAGQDLNLRPGSPNLIERIEGGLMSYGNEMTRQNNPFECGLDRYCQLDGSVDYIGLEALRRIDAEGVKQQIRGLIFSGDPCPPVSQAWSVLLNDARVGQVTSAVWSPRFQKNVGLGMISHNHWDHGSEVLIVSEDGEERYGMVSQLPMIDLSTA